MQPFTFLTLVGLAMAASHGRMPEKRDLHPFVDILDIGAHDLMDDVQAGFDCTFDCETAIKDLEKKKHRHPTSGETPPSHSS